ncbi:MAG: hypothetical protein ACXWBN_08750 [Acidimicrobiales bacterium]
MTRSMTRSRLVAVLASALVVAACASSGSRAVSGDDTGSTEPGGPATFHTTIAPEPDPGATTGSTATPTVPGGAIDCGRFDLASGWPTTIAPSPTLLTCLDDAFRSGTPARLVLSAQTDGQGGSPVITTYLVTGQGIVHVTVDATRAADRPQVVSTKECRALTLTSPEPTVSNCENMAD